MLYTTSKLKDNNIPTKNSSDFLRIYNCGIQAFSKNSTAIDASSVSEHATLEIYSTNEWSRTCFRMGPSVIFFPIDGDWHDITTNGFYFEEKEHNWYDGLVAFNVSNFPACDIVYDIRDWKITLKENNRNEIDYALKKNGSPYRFDDFISHFNPDNSIHPYYTIWEADISKLDQNIGKEITAKKKSYPSLGKVYKEYDEENGYYFRVRTDKSWYYISSYGGYTINQLPWLGDYTTLQTIAPYTEITLKIRCTPMRSNHTLFYLSKGNANILLNNQQYTADEGDLIYLSPDSNIKFEFTVDSEYYWITFGGNSVTELLNKSGICVPNIYRIGVIPNIYEIICETYYQLLTPSDNSFLRCNEMFMRILVSISDNLSSKFQASSNKTINKILPAIQRMHLFFHESHSLDYYANLCDMSISSFKHTFKSILGISPQSYLINIRLERAKTLILTTNDSIKDIAYSVGYDDPFYFSRLFTKKYGISPKKFSNKN